MMPERSARTRRLLGDERVSRIEDARVLIFGIGGVGSYTAEALVRAGIGRLTLVDRDVVDESNINRQLIALGSTVGLPKAEAAKARYLDINPQAQITAVQDTVLPETIVDYHFEAYDYIVDAVDMVTAKLAIIAQAKALQVPVISSMGTGNKVHPEQLELTDIAKTSVCPLAKVMRKELKNRRIKHVPVVYSREEPLMRCTPPGSISTVPSAAGLIIASKVINDIVNID